MDNSFYLSNNVIMAYVLRRCRLRLLGHLDNRSWDDWVSDIKMWKWQGEVIIIIINNNKM